MPRKRTQDSSSLSVPEGGAAAAPARAAKPAAAKSARTKKAKAETVAAPAELVSEQEEIARLAYSYWEARGCPGESNQEDWFRAEREIRDRRRAGRS